MKKTTLILGGISFMGAASAMAAVTCTPAPSCGDLGYSASASSCSGDYLVCPFDTSKVHCINVPDQCTELGYTKVATNGTYTCPDGQTVSKCVKNTTKYKCDGTACSYGYYLSSKMPSCPYKYCCQQAQYNNSSCYTWRDNSSYKDYEYDAARCKAAAFHVETPPDCQYQYNCTNTNEYGPGYVQVRAISGSNSTDACGNAQYEAKQGSGCNSGGLGYQSCYGSNIWEFIPAGRPGYDYSATGWPQYGPGGEAVCASEYAYKKTYNYNGEALTFAKYCYKKYNIWISCAGLKFRYIDEAIPWDFDRTY